MCVLCESQENPDGSTTLFIAGGSYEVVFDSQGAEASIRKYYAIGGQRVMREDDSNYYLLTDHLGSVVGIADGSGSLVSEQRFLPYGVPRLEPGADETDFGFTGQRLLDDVGLVDYNARWFDPSLSTFVSADSFGGQDVYAYALDSPVLYIDPTGHMACLDIDCHILWDPSPGRIVTRNNGPTELDIQDLRHYKGGKSGTAGYDYYFSYLEYWDKGVWRGNENLKSYTIWNFMELSIAREFDGIKDPTNLGEGAARAYGEACKTWYGTQGCTSVEALVNAFAEYNSTASSISETALKAASDKELTVIRSVLSSLRASVGSGLSWASDRPYGWANFSLYDKYHRDILLQIPHQFYFQFRSGGDPWFMPSGCVAVYWLGLGRPPIDLNHECPVVSNLR